MMCAENSGEALASTGAGCGAPKSLKWNISRPLAVGTSVAIVHVAPRSSACLAQQSFTRPALLVGGSRCAPPCSPPRWGGPCGPLQRASLSGVSHPLRPLSRCLCCWLRSLLMRIVVSRAARVPLAADVRGSAPPRPALRAWLVWVRVVTNLGGWGLFTIHPFTDFFQKLFIKEVVYHGFDA